jgi:hypothetical protein
MPRDLHPKPPFLVVEARRGIAVPSLVEVQIPAVLGRRRNSQNPVQRLGVPINEVTEGRGETRFLHFDVSILRELIER